MKVDLYGVFALLFLAFFLFWGLAGIYAVWTGNVFQFLMALGFGAVAYMKFNMVLWDREESDRIRRVLHT